MGSSLTIKLSNPVKIVETDQAGFQVSGWKSLIDKHNLKRILTQTILIFEFND